MMNVKTLVVAAFAGIASLPAHADVLPELTPYQWENRLLLVFSNDAQSPDAEKLRQDIIASRAGFDDRDMVLYEILADGQVLREGQYRPGLIADDFFDHFDVDKDSLTSLLIGKDGLVKARYGAGMDTNSVFALIDTMPMRQQEMRERL